MSATRRGRSRLLRGLLIGAAAAVLSFGLHSAGLLESFEARTWDWRVRLMAEPGPATGRIALILLDQQSLDWAQKENGLSWPWPREVYGYVMDYLAEAGAKVAAFDVLFLEPSGYGVFDDEALGGSSAAFGRTVGAFFLREDGGADAWPEGAPRPALRFEGLESWIAGGGAGLRYPRASFPVPEFAAGVAALGNVHLLPDRDGIYRRAPLLALFGDTPVPTLPIAAYLAGKSADAGANAGAPGAAAGSSGAAADVSFSGGELRIDGMTVPLDREGRALLRYRGPSGTHPAYSAAAVIRSRIQMLSGETPDLDPALFRDRYVFFGFSAPGLLDLRPAPVSGVYTGVEINATVLDNLLSGDFLRRMHPVLHLLAAFVLAAAAGIAAASVSGLLPNAVLYGLFLPLPPLLSLLAYRAGFQLPLVGTESALLLTLVSSGLVNYATEGRQKRYLKSAFRQYLSPTVIEQLIAQPDRLKLGGERKELSIFFSDLQGFTSISEMLSPEDLTSLLNEYLSAMTDIILEEGGTIDKYEGDAIIAFWNAPLDQPDHADRAVRSALRCQAKLAEMRPGFRERVGRDLFMRVGINTGAAVVGNMGSSARFDYTMLGDAVNLAARLEGINKQFGTYTMISRMTLERTTGGFAARELSRVAVVGRKEPVVVYEPMTIEEHARNAEILQRFADGLENYYRGDFSAAEQVFRGIAAEDPAAAAYAERCETLIRSTPESWSGVWVMTSK